MNTLTYAAPTDVIDDVLDAVAPTALLTAPLQTELGGAAAQNFELAVRESWVRFRNLVTRCAREGYDAVRAELADFITQVDTIAVELGTRADEFRQAVLAKIRETIAETFDTLLGSMRSSVQLGGRTYILDAITLEQKLVYSSSLEVSLTSLCKFIGGGEIVVTGSYKTV